MKELIILDTNILVSNRGKINTIVDKISEKYDVFIPQLVIDEYINLEIREEINEYNQLLSLKKIGQYLDIKMVKQDIIEKQISEKYKKVFKEVFKDNIIIFNKEYKIELVLERDSKKLPPFINEKGSSDKGFKDTLILLSIIEYCTTNDINNTVNFLTFDNAFIKYKDDIEEEFIDTTKCKLNIIDGKNINTVYSHFGIDNKEEKNNVEENELEKLDIEDMELVHYIRKNLKDICSEILSFVESDWNNNYNTINNFTVYVELENNNIENFLINIDQNLKKYIFDEKINIELMFTEDVSMSTAYPIDIELFERLSQLYKKVKENKTLKLAFINYIKNQFNKNIATFTDTSDLNDNDNDNNDELPF